MFKTKYIVVYINNLFKLKNFSFHCREYRHLLDILDLSTVTGFEKPTPCVPQV
jgi:hypothetical protein